MKIYIAGNLCSSATLIAAIGCAQERGIEVDIVELRGEEPGTVMIHKPESLFFSGSIELSAKEVRAIKRAFKVPIPKEIPASIEYKPSRYNRRANRAARDNWRK